MDGIRISSIAIRSLPWPPVEPPWPQGHPIPSTTEYSQEKSSCHQAMRKPAAATNMQVTFNGLHDSGMPPQRDIGSSILRSPMTYEASTIGPSTKTTVRTSSLDTSMHQSNLTRCLNVSILAGYWMPMASEKHHIRLLARRVRPRDTDEGSACDLAVMIRGSQPRYPGSSPGVRTRYLLNPRASI